MWITSKKSLEGRLKAINESLVDGIYKHHPYKGKYLFIDLSHKHDNMYQIFAYLNYFMLVPSLFLDAIDKPVYKADSFRIAEEYLSPESIEHIRELSLIRKDWARLEGLTKDDNSIPDWIIERLGSNFIYKAKRLVVEVLVKINECNAR